jgi:hypothetical protein
MIAAPKDSHVDSFLGLLIDVLLVPLFPDSHRDKKDLYSNDSLPLFGALLHGANGPIPGAD